MKPDRKVNLSNHLNKNQQNSFKIHRKNIENFNFGWSHVDDADDIRWQIFQMNPIIANQSSIICNHLNKTKQNPTKQL